MSVSILTTEEAQQIAAMRETLDAISTRLNKQKIDETYESAGTDLYNLGQFRESVNQAEHALFRALNVCSSYLHCEACAEALDRAEVTA